MSPGNSSSFHEGKARRQQAALDQNWPEHKFRSWLADSLLFLNQYARNMYAREPIDLRQSMAERLVWKPKSQKKLLPRSRFVETYSSIPLPRSNIHISV